LDWLEFYNYIIDDHLNKFKRDFDNNPDLLEEDVFEEVIKPKTNKLEKEYCRFKNDLFDSFRSLFITIENDEQINKRINKFIKYDIPKLRDKNQIQFDLNSNNTARLNTWDPKFLSADENKIVKYLIERYTLWKIRNREEGFDLLMKVSSTTMTGTNKVEVYDIHVKDILKDSLDWQKIITFLSSEKIMLEPVLILKDNNPGLVNRPTAKQALNFFIRHLTEQNYFSTKSYEKIATAWKHSVSNFKVDASTLRKKPYYTPPFDADLIKEFTYKE